MGPGRERDVVGLSDFPTQQWYWAEISREKNFFSPSQLPEAEKLFFPISTPRGSSDFQCTPV